LLVGAGSSVAMEADRIVLGRPWIENDGGDQIGEVEIVELSGAWLGDACTDPAACVSGYCVLDVCCDDSCTGACEVCTVAAGASQDGTCERVTGPQCCIEEEDCGAPPTCASYVCEPDHTCRLERTCCESDADCSQQPPCVVHCVEGSCVPEPDCVPDPTATDGGPQESTTADPSGDGTSGGGVNDNGGSCSCRSTNAAMLWPVIVLLSRRRRAQPSGS
jgi:hypothetical protein